MKRFNLSILFVLAFVVAAFAETTLVDAFLDNGTIATIISLLFTVLAAVGVTLVKVMKVIKAVGESADVAAIGARILEKKNVTEEDVANFVRELNEAQGAWKDVKVSFSK
jgi:hypothetical protein